MSNNNNNNNNDDGPVSLFRYIIKQDLDGILQAIENKNFDENETNNGVTPLFAILVSMYDNDPKNDPELIDNFLLLEDCAIKLIESGKSNPGFVIKNSKNIEKTTTALLFCCKNNYGFVAKALIRTGQSFPDFISLKSSQTDIRNENTTALIEACKYPHLSDIVKEILETGKSNLHFKTPGEYSAIGFAIEYKSYDSALHIIQYDPECLNIVYRFNSSPLLLACTELFELEVIAEILMLKDIILRMIGTGKSNTEYINGQGRTALSQLLYLMGKTSNHTIIDAAIHIARAIIATNKHNPFTEDNFVKTALDYATELKRSGMSSVGEIVSMLKTPPPEILDMRKVNVNAVGFDAINQENIVISDYFTQNRRDGPVCFKLVNSYYLTTINILRRQFNNVDNRKYSCKLAGDTNWDYHFDNIDDYTRLNNYNYISNSNIHRVGDGPQLVSLFLIGIPGLLSIESLQTANWRVPYYYLQVIRSVESVMGAGFLHGNTGGVSADHCQPGKRTLIYGLISCTPEDGPRDIVANERAVQAPETESEAESVLRKLKIKYKGNDLEFSVSDTMTIGELKTLFLQMLLSSGKINKVDGKIVEFIYRGIRYKSEDDNRMVSSIQGITNYSTLLSIVKDSQNVGGRRRSRHNRTKKMVNKRRVNKGVNKTMNKTVNKKKTYTRHKR